MREIMTLPMHPPMSGGRHMYRARLIIPLVRLVTILSLLVTSSGPKVAAAATSVADSAADISITATGFQPADLTVTAGTPVVWVNRTSKSHTLASGEVRRLYMPLILRGVSRSLTSTASAPNTAQSAVYEPMQPAAEPLFAYRWHLANRSPILMPSRASILIIWPMIYVSPVESSSSHLRSRPIRLLLHRRSIQPCRRP